MSAFIVPAYNLWNSKFPALRTYSSKSLQCIMWARSKSSPTLSRLPFKSQTSARSSAVFPVRCLRPGQNPEFRIRDILVWIRIRGSVPLTNGSCSFRQWPSKPTKNHFFVCLFLCLLLFDVHLHHSSKIKSHKEVTKTAETKVFSNYFCSMIEGSGLWLTNPDAGGPRTYGPGTLEIFRFSCRPQ
jgi:hypothetical protein